MAVLAEVEVSALVEAPTLPLSTVPLWVPWPAALPATPAPAPTPCATFEPVPAPAPTPEPALEPAPPPPEPELCAYTPAALHQSAAAARPAKVDMEMRIFASLFDGLKKKRDCCKFAPFIAC